MAKKQQPSQLQVKHKGIPVELGGETYIVPPLNLGAVERMQERLQNFSGGIDMESISVVIDATHAALLRNYPEITREEIIDLIDVGNMMEVFQAVMDISGLKRKALEGEAPEVAESGEDPSTGGNSTPT